MATMAEEPDVTASPAPATAPPALAPNGYAEVDNAVDSEDERVDRVLSSDDALEGGGGHGDECGTFDYPHVKGGFLSRSLPMLGCGEKIGRLRRFRPCGREVWLGPCWPMPPATAGIIVGLSYLLLKNITDTTPIFLLVPAFLMCAVVLSAFLRTALSNPGVVPRYPTRPDTGLDDEASWVYHEPSSSWYRKGTRWCEECEVFVKGYDHFCPWTGTVIGAGNKSQFNMFVSSIFLTLMYIVILIASF